MITPFAPLASAASSPALRHKSYSSNLDAHTSKPTAESRIEQPKAGAALANPASAAVFVGPTISATKTDSFPDPDNDNRALPGDTITYTVTITNAAGADAALGVVFSDTIDANTTLVAGSIQSTPVAVDDIYSASGNIQITVNAATGVLSNDTDPDGDPLTASAGATSAKGGNVTMNTDGSFTYNPPRGYEGADTFTYTITDTVGGGTSTGTVTFNISGMIWFINNNLGAAGDGRLTSPYNSLAAFNAVNGQADVPASNIYNPQASDNIFLYRQTATDYTGGITLLSNQKLIGQGATASLSTITGINPPAGSLALPPTGGTNPVIVNGGGNDVTIAAASAGNLIRGVSLGNASGSAIATGAGFGTLTILEASISTTGQALNLNTGTLAATLGTLTSGGGVNNINFNAVGGSLTASSGNLSGSSGTALNIVGGNATISYPGNITNTAGQRGISTANVTGGSLTVSGTVSVSGSGASNDAIVIDGNDTNPYTVSINAVSINTNSMDDGILLSDLPAGSSVTITSGSVTSQGAGHRVIAFETAAGVAENTAGTYNFSGVDFNNNNGDGTLFGAGQTGTYSFRDLDVNAPNGGTGVTVTGNSAVITFRSIDQNGGATGINISNTTGSFTVNGDGTFDRNGSGGTIQNTSASAVILNNATDFSVSELNIQNISTASADGINATNLKGSNNLYRAGVFSGITSANSNGIQVQNTNTNLGKLEVNNSLFTGSGTGDDGILFEGFGTSVMRLDVINNTHFNGIAGDGVQVDPDGTSNLTVNILNSRFSNDAANPNGTSRLSFFSVNGSTLNATVQGNVFNQTGQQSGVPVAAIGVLDFVTNQTSSVTVNVDNNDFNGSPLDSAIRFIADDSTQSINLTINNNDINAYGREAILFDSRENSRGGNVKITNNRIGTVTPVGGGTSAAGAQEAVEVRVRNDATATATQNLNLLLNNNQIVSTGTNETVDLDSEALGSFAVSLNATVTNNTLTNNSTGNSFSADTESANSSFCLDLRNNNSNKGFVLTETAGTFSVENLASVAGGTAGNTGAVTFNPNQAAFSNSAGCQDAALLNGIESNQRDFVAQSNASYAGYSTNRQPAAAKQPSQTFSHSDRTGFAPLGTIARTGIKGEKPVASKASAKPSALAAANTAMFAPAFTRNIGTLPGGKSVTITFQVTVNAPLPTGVTQVANQGQITGSNFSQVLTDDPAASGASNPTVTLVGLPEIIINNAKVAEPASGSTDMLFTLSLSFPFPSAPVTVQYVTSDGSATSPGDYTGTTTPTTITFAPGETFKTLAVPVNADADNTEGDETFTVTLSSPSNATILTGTATGTIKPTATPAQALISEFRASGPGNPVGTGTANDEFVEIYNNTDQPLNISGWSVVKLASVCTTTPVVIATVPASTTLPARGHYLITGANYGLSGYATSNLSLALGIEDDASLGIFSTATANALSSDTRVDGVSFGTNTADNCALFREGNTLTNASGSASQYSFVRKQFTGLSQDTGDNAADFMVVSTTPTTPVGGNTNPLLGAPGPENLTSPRLGYQSPTQFISVLINPAAGEANSPNRVRNTDSYTDTLTPSAPNGGAPASNPYTLGTLSVQKRYFNNSGQDVTRLRFRIVDITTLNSPLSVAPPQADLRVLSSNGTVKQTGGGTVMVVNGLTLEQSGGAMNQPRGGGWNSTVAAGTITLGTPLKGADNPGTPQLDNMIDLQFLLGVASSGKFRFYIIIEALP